MTNDEQNWSHWMSAAQRGDEHAYQLLLAEVGEVIAAYLYARFGSLEMMEDCVQECLISVHCARHTYDPKRPFRPWLFAIVRNKAIDMLRSQYSYKSMIHQGHHIARDTSSIEDHVARGSVFAALNPAQREILMLTKIIGLSVAEAADRLGVSESAVKVRVHRAIKASRRILEAKGVDG